MIGHDRICADLKRAADRGTLSHAYAFVGGAGVGKRLAAESFANYLESGTFEPSARILSDALFLSPDEAGTIGIDAVRAAKAFLFQKPNRSLRRTLVVDGAECLTAESANALLKIAEEPPVSALLIILAASDEAVMPTLRSRLQKLYFGTVPAEAISAWLSKEKKIAPGLARQAALRSRGKPGLAFSIAADKKFRARLASAEALLRLRANERRDFIKRMVEKKDFDALDFLDALLVAAVPAGGFSAPSAAFRFIHGVLALKREFSRVNPNPRLQLENLLLSHER